MKSESKELSKSPKSHDIGPVPAGTAKLSKKFIAFACPFALSKFSPKWLVNLAKIKLYYYTMSKTTEVPEVFSSFWRMAWWISESKRAIENPLWKRNSLVNHKSRILLAISKRKACCLLLHLHSLLASSILENSVILLSGWGISQLLSHLGTVLPWYYPSCLFLHEMTLVTSCFPFLQQPFEAVAFRVEQTGAGSPELQRQDGTVVSSGPGQFGFSSSIASPILEYLHGHFWESWVVEFELISLRDFVTCHLCPFVELLQ